MLKKNRSAPNTAVIPVLYYPDVREAVEWLTTALPFTERLRNSDTRRQLLHSNGAIIVAQPGAHADAAPSTPDSPRAHSATLRDGGRPRALPRRRSCARRDAGLGGDDCPGAAD